MVSISGRRSVSGETGRQRATLPRTGSATSGHSIRNARCPPAEWPVSTTGPATRPAAAATAAAMSAVICGTVAAGHSR